MYHIKPFLRIDEPSPTTHSERDAAYISDTWRLSELLVFLYSHLDDDYLKRDDIFIRPDPTLSICYQKDPVHCIAEQPKMRAVINTVVNHFGLSELTEEIVVEEIILQQYKYPMTHPNLTFTFQSPKTASLHRLGEHIIMKACEPRELFRYLKIQHGLWARFSNHFRIKNIRFTGKIPIARCSNTDALYQYFTTEGFTSTRRKRHLRRTTIID